MSIEHLIFRAKEKLVYVTRLTETKVARSSTRLLHSLTFGSRIKGSATIKSRFGGWFSFWYALDCGS